MMKKVVVIDYGSGNLWSVCNALRYLEVGYEVSQSPKVIAEAEALLLPGVGAFRQSMIQLNNKGLSDAIKEAVLVRQRNILGICLGFQMLGQSSKEGGYCSGLGLIPGSFESFSNKGGSELKIPHIGFNTVYSQSSGRLFKNLDRETDFYFVHSFRMEPANLPGEIAICHYGCEFVAAYENQNIFGTQFHPEKSQTNGLILLRNFVSAA